MKKSAIFALGLLGVAACTPPQSKPAPTPPTPPACTADVTTFAYGEEITCVPTPPDRVDVLFDLLVFSDTSANAECQRIGGAPTQSLPDDPAWTRRCRSVDVSRV